MVQQRAGMVTNVDFDRLTYMAQRPQYRGIYAQQLTELAQELGQLRVIPSDKAPRTLVTMNSRVQVVDLDDQEMEVFTLVYPEDANINEGKVSALSPIGRALLGRRSGETVEVAAPLGARRMKIQKIVYQPEAAGHFEL